MNRTLSFLVLAAAIVMVGAGCFRPRTSVQPPAETNPPVQTVAPIAVIALNGGAGTVTRADQTEPLLDGLEVMPGDTIAATSGTVALVYTGAGASKLEQGSTITVLPDGEGDGSVFAQIELVAGSIWTRFERLLGGDERFSVAGNNVVATVRGTAFGMELADGEADVQVAENEVDVRLFRTRKDMTKSVTTVRVARGEGLRINAERLMKLDVEAAQKMIRKLGTAERQRTGFKFMSTKFRTDLLKKRARVRWDLMPDIPEKFRDRIDPAMLERILKLRELRVNPTFIAPFRPILSSDLAPALTPSDTATSDGINLLDVPAETK